MKSITARSYVRDLSELHTQKQFNLLMLSTRRVDRVDPHAHHDILVGFSVGESDPEKREASSVRSGAPIICGQPLGADVAGERVPE